jgi:predicted phage terminase large subunit-like protein
LSTPNVLDFVPRGAPQPPRAELFQETESPREIRPPVPPIETEEILAEKRDALAAEAARRHLRLFIPMVWSVIEFERPFIDNWHIALMCEDLEALARGEIDREIFNVPPGTMKSILLNVIFPAWLWASNPRLRFLKASYSDHLSIRDNVKLRDVVSSPWYRRYFNVRLVDDQNQKKKFDTTEGGWSVATSVGGAGTGEHPDYVFIDDPVTAEQASSDVERQRANDWFDQTISTRGVIRDVRCAVIMQRLHEEDLSGHLLARGGWSHLLLQMRYEPTRLPKEGDPGWVAEPRDPRSTPGELLWPAMLTEAKVRKMELDLGPYGAAGQLQQRPSPEGGGLFQRGWFKFIDAAAVPRVGTRWARGWDTAGTENDGDWTQGVKVGVEFKNAVIGGKHVALVERVFVAGCHGGQWGPATVDAEMRATAELDGKACTQCEEKEGGASGKAITLAHAKMLAAFNYKCVTIGADKVTRAKPFRSQCEAGTVFIVRTGDPAQDAWITPWLAELCAFPTAKHDDRVDATDCAYNALLEDAPIAVEATWGR